ncbi:enoyl-CoA hydratase/isomerase family protein [Microbacterium sp. X-17]|uniref:enoyl-CoA hydratase/isomerase family protein n=1 Tax=Microbacterium sp. X-17 TaxID=3144404 RepID=UPI0031F5D0AD
MSSPYETITYVVEDHVAVLTLNRPAKLNAMSTELMAELRDCFAEINADTDVRVLVITGAGEKAFSTGFDLDLGETDPASPEYAAYIKGNFDTLMQLWNLRVPSVAAVNGYALAAGSTLALTCDITVAAEHAQFGEPEIRHYALSPMLPMLYFSGNPRMAHYLYYTGDMFTAQEAKEYGIIAKAVPSESLMDEALRIARRISMVAPYSVQLTKDSIRNTYENMGFSRAMNYHRLADTLSLTAHGIPEKDELREARRADVRTFLQMRDGPFRA